MTFAGVCFAFVNICQKKEKRENNEKMGFGFYSKVIHVMSMKKVENSFAIFWFHAIFALDLQVKPLFFKFSHFGTAKTS